MKIQLSTTVSKIGSIVLIALVAIALAYSGNVRQGGLCLANENVGSGNDNGYVIGIDLGTKYSVVSVYRNGMNEIIPNDQGHATTPSIVAFNEYDRLIGDSAYNQMQMNPTNTIFDAKRLIGRPFDDPIVQKDMKLWPFKVVQSSDGLPSFQVSYKNETKLFKPEQISAMVLSKMKQIAETYLGEPVTNAVVTVPAYFNDNQRIATRLAGQIAGLNVLRIINEPTAASIAFGLNSEQNKEKNIIVYDLGGGTFDVTLLTLDDGVFEVIATDGDTHLGGEDFDTNVINYFVKKFNEKYKIDLTNPEYNRGLSKLRKECEKAKRALSSPDTKQIKIEIDNIVNGIDFSEQLTQARFESLNNKLFLQTLKPLKQVLNESKFKISDIDEVVMVGGSTRIPKIQSIVSKFFENKQLNFGINPDEAVANGAAIQAAILSNHKLQSSKNPMVVLDATPLSLGIKTVGGVFSKIINKNEAIPTTKSQIFSTYQDNQQTVTIEVYQGERAMVNDNIFLGNFNLNGIERAPRGVPQIEVTFNIDADGIVKVEAKEKNKSNNNHASITIDQQSARPSDDQIDQMLKDEQRFKDNDKLIIDKIKLKNELESQAYSIKNNNEDNEEIVQVCDEIIEWLEMNDINQLDIDDLKDKKNEFNDIISGFQSDNNNDDDYHDFDHEDL